MVCKEHKSVPKAKINKYRDERRKAKTTRATGAKRAPAKKVAKTTPRSARARKLQGQCIGALNGLAAGDKVKVKQVAKEKGLAEAVKLAQSLKKAKAGK
jgi:hypothetical protein